MKYLVIFFLISCSNDYDLRLTELKNVEAETNESILKAAKTIKKNDSLIRNIQVVMNNSNKLMRLLLLQIEAANNSIEYREKRDSLEILYLKTGNEKYRSLGNKYDDLKVKVCKTNAYLC